jgi:hypothetical protein
MMTDRGTIEWEIAEAIRRYAVRVHYVESSKRRASVYAVWDKSGQVSARVSELTDHRCACRDCLRLQVAAIMEIMDRELRNAAS